MINFSGNGRVRWIVVGVLSAVILTSCTSSPTPPTPTPQPSPPASSASSLPTPAPQATSPTATPSEIPEPTTTNTLPPPPSPTAAAPSTAGDLDSRSLPTPAGWRTTARPGGAEEGYRGNGTWVHARDPRYAAQDLITIGCAQITRDDYTDPVDALEGSYANADDDPGVGLILQFAQAADAKAFFALYRQQVAACASPDGPVQIKIINSSLGLIDQRSYPGDDNWTEVAAVHGTKATFVILTDPDHRLSRAAAEDILRQLN